MVYDSDVPPSRQVADILRAEILSGARPPGSRLPSIVHLMQDYGIARNTARRALLILRDEYGLAVIRPGWGSFVRRDIGPE